MSGRKEQDYEYNRKKDNNNSNNNKNFRKICDKTK